MRLLLVSLLLSLCQFSFGQNALPVFTNVSALADTINHQLRVFYDLSDAENEDCDVKLRVSSNDTSYTVVLGTNVYGDVGFPITPGAGKMVIWDYGQVHHPAVLDYTVKLVADDQYPIDIQAIVDQVDSTNLWSDLTWMEGIRHHTANPTFWNDVRDSLNARFASYGLETWNMDFTFSGINAANVVSRLPGCTDEHLTIINDAHFDGVSGAPAADDNATGVVAVLEAARILSQYAFKKNLRFIAFDLEEAGIVGSARYVNDGGIQDWENIEAVLNYEMIGYYSDRDSSQTFPNGFDQLFPDAYDSMVVANWKGDFLANVANVPSDWLRAHYDSVAAIYVPELRVISIATPGTGIFTPDLRRSDHARFWDGNIAALMLTDAAEFRNNNYHTVNDVKDSLNLEFLTNNCKATVANLATLAGLSHCAVTFEDITVNPETGLDEANDCTMNFGPNPAREGSSVSVKAPPCYGESESYLKVLDQQGKVVREQKLVGLQTARLDLSSGVYYLHLSGDNLPSQVEKLIVLGR